MAHQTVEREAMKREAANDQPDLRGSGYDAARSNREEDHLNRWPFA
jgi:hypothetical protein